MFLSAYPHQLAAAKRPRHRITLSTYCFLQLTWARRYQNEPEDLPIDILQREGGQIYIGSFSDPQVSLSNAYVCTFAQWHQWVCSLVVGFLTVCDSGRSEDLRASLLELTRNEPTNSNSKKFPLNGDKNIWSTQGFEPWTTCNHRKFPKAGMLPLHHAN